MPPSSSAPLSAVSAAAASAASAAGAPAKAAAASSRAVFAPRRWHERGAADHGWLKTFHTFSFASYHDPRYEDFGPLRVLNEDRVAPRTGFPTHPHANAEIFSYIISGELTHKDSLGNVEILKRGEVQFTSAGSGIRHSEYNDHKKEGVHFLQIWYTPDTRNLPPKYYTLPTVSDASKRDVLLTLIRPASTFTPAELALTGLLPAGRAIPAHAALVTRASLLSPGAVVRHEVGQETGEKEGERWLYVHLAMGSGWKDPDAYREGLRRKVQGNQPHNERLKHAAKFLEHVYGQAPSWASSSTASASTQSAQEGQEQQPARKPEPKGRPQVTLTFAQSIDGFIAGPGKKQVALSAPESFVMTHAMRTMHDGILVGVGTLKNDDPQLNARLLNPLPSGEAPSLASLPRPIVLDTSLSTPLGAKILRNFAAGTGQRPLIVTGVDGAHSRAGWAERRAALADAGAEILEVASSASDAQHLEWTAVLAALDGAGIKRLMVEGGASIISSLLSAHSASPDEPLIDALVVTISRQALGEGESYAAPTWLARSLLPGRVKSSKRGKARALLSKTLSAEPFGMDFVLAWGGAPPTQGTQATIRVADTVLEEGDGVFVKGAMVGEMLEIENLSGRDAEIVLFDVKPEQ